MRTKLLLISLFSFSGGLLQAQDTIRSLIISEARLDKAYHAYVELTNRGDSTLHLNRFEFGVVHPWNLRIDTTDLGKWFHVGEDSRFMLPDTTLDPGESFVFTRDILSSFGKTGQVSGGGDCWYVRYDSTVTDQVGGIFTGPGGQQVGGAKDVAGISGATGNSILVRKFSIKQGNIDFEKGRGNNEPESEWIVIPLQVNDTTVTKSQFWTVGNDINANLGPETLVSVTVTINRADSTLVFPWGIRRGDPVMNEFSRKPGIAWHYDYFASYHDSAFLSVRSGDILTLYACGDEAEIIPFRIIVSDATDDANIVIPKRLADPRLSFAGQGPLYEVTENVPGMDTISGNLLSANSSAAHIDTIYKYLELAPNAQWEIVFNDGIERIFVKNGDILKVTSGSGKVKEYFIKVSGQFIENEAFVTSDIYMVDQINYYIVCDRLSDDSISVIDFLSNLIPSAGATLKVLNAQGVEKTDKVEFGDILVVTSADGFRSIYYTIEVFVLNANSSDFNSIKIFPNPALSVVNVSGIPAQSWIVIKDFTGRNIIETAINNDTMQFAVEDHPAGLYFILISTDTRSACYKLIVKQ